MAPSCRPNNRRPVHANGPVEAASLPCHSPARRRIERLRSRGRLHVSLHPPHTAIFSPAACLPGFAVSPPRPVWQAEEAVANLPLRLAVRVHCGRQVGRGSRGMPNPPRVLEGYSRHTLGDTATGVSGFGVRGFGFGLRPSGYRRDSTLRGMRCRRRQSAPSLVRPEGASAAE